MIFLLLPISLCLQVNPSEINMTAKAGETKLYNFVVKNDVNETKTFTFSVTGAITQGTWVTLVSPTSKDLGYNEETTVTLATIIPSDAQPGTYQGTFKVSDGTNEYSYNIYIIIPKWVWESDNILFNISSTYRLYPQQVDVKLLSTDLANQKASISISGSQIDLTQGQCYEEDSFKICAIDVDYNSLIAKFYSAYENSYVELVESQPPSEELPTQNLFFFIPSTIVRTIVGWQKTTIKLSLYNSLDCPVQLKNLYFDGTLTTASGEKPTRVENYDLGILYPNQEKTFTVTIDTYDLTEGTYTTTLHVVGLCGLNVVDATATFTIKVISTPSPLEGQINYNVPEQVSAGEVYEIKIYNVPEDIVYEINTNNANVIDKKLENNVLTIKLKSVQKGSALISITLKKGSNIVWQKTFEVTVTAPPQPVIINIPDRVERNKPLTIQTIPQDATIYIDGVEATSRTFTPTKESYEICAEAPGYRRACKVIYTYIPMKNMVLECPDEVKVGETIMCTARDAETNEILTVDWYVDDRPVEPPLKIDEPGMHTIKAIAPYYNPAIVNINVVQPLELTNISYSTVNKPVTFTFNRETTWTIKFGDKIIKQGSGTRGSFVPTEPGVYTLVTPELTQEFYVKQASIFEKYGEVGEIWLYVVIFVITLLGLIAFRKYGGKVKKEKKESLSLGAPVVIEASKEDVEKIVEALKKKEEGEKKE